ncbi:hypothetical protein BDN70DRAFT_890877 [Pholiota conissans]|uniref:Uncharacterized protein n=1 Tax=Pholiota conissans TaxID=109636 RepID=A0A9P6CYY9_9AGAR|nr:hypothetical protein BDN70DRAFT_890877 [Pholiota conissans]
MTCRSRSSVNLGDFTVSGCDCFPSPSCTLFPRRADGKVVLPNPLDLLKNVSCHGATVRLSTNHRPHTSSRLTANDERPSTASCYCPDCALTMKDDIDAASTSSEQNQLVENYAQIRSLPEFKAFKLNHEGKAEPRKRANTTPNPHPKGGVVVNKTKSGQEWMEEIRVTRRTRKQAYVLKYFFLGIESAFGYRLRVLRAV